MNWTILIATLGQREERFMRLMNMLLPQVEDLKGQVTILAYWNNFELPLGEIRQKLVDEARGDYVNFIDDDDKIPGYYCDLVTEKLGKDYVGWRMQAYDNNKPLKPTFHSIKYPEWSEDDKGFYRNISHLNPIKRSVALKASFLTPEGEAEDYSWAKTVAPFVKSENYIDSVMYHYYHSADDSLWRGGRELNRFTRPLIESEYFRWHPDSRSEYGNS